MHHLCCQKLEKYYTVGMNSWVDRFKTFPVTDDVLKSMGSLPTMDYLDCEPTTEELSKAVDLMAPWKVPGSDSIPADLLRYCKSSLLPHLHDILVKCWREGMVPQDMRDDLKT